MLLDLFELFLFVLLLRVHCWFEGCGSRILFLVVSGVGFWKFFFSFSFGVSGLGCISSFLLLLASIFFLGGLINCILGHLLKGKISRLVYI